VIGCGGHVGCRGPVQLTHRCVTARTTATITTTATAIGTAANVVIDAVMHGLAIIPYDQIACVPRMTNHVLRRHRMVQKGFQEGLAFGSCPAGEVAGELMVHIQSRSTSAGPAISTDLYNNRVLGHLR